LALGLAPALGWPLGLWWLAVAQAHGHAQLFGWCGLMVLGVGLHLMPRLRGAPLQGARFAPLVLGAIGGGIVLRALAQPALAAGVAAELARVVLPLSGVLELAGALTAIGMLVATLRSGPPLDTRSGLRPVLPFFAVAFGSLLVALAINLIGLFGGEALVAGGYDRAVVLLGLEGFLVPVTVGMSMRTFPLYFRTPLPCVGVVQAGLVLWGVGLLSRLGGVPLAELVQAGGVLLFVVGLRVFASPVPRPRDPVHPLLDPARWHALAAYGWLVGSGLVLALGGSGDAERHLLGAGFITLLIFGVGAHMLPGFAKRGVRSRALVWATLALGNGAAALRVLPALWALPTAGAGAVYAAAGVLGLLAVAAFALNAVPLPEYGRPSSPDR
jgi:uncharacterized protein involved in response to NO